MDSATVRGRDTVTRTASRVQRYGVVVQALKKLSLDIAVHRVTAHA
ncbi:MAG: hypothetical protein JO266_21855 [Acidobacteria bacterium]|nr:hypothetical protein [Acidobacteriota bacterium]